MVDVSFEGNCLVPVGGILVASIYSIRLDWRLIFNTLDMFVHDWQSIESRTMSDSLSWLSPSPIEAWC